jgi:Peptidase M15
MAIFLAVGLRLAGAPVLAESRSAGNTAGAFDPGRAGFQVHYKDEISPYTVNAVFLMPGEVLRLEVPGEDSGGFTFEYEDGEGGVDSSGKLTSAGPRSWKWRAPDSAGVYPLELSRADGEAVRFNAFVMVPATETKEGYLHGYHIGEYPPPIKKTEFYQAPRGFIKADAAAAQALVSPHFKLGQFFCKQTPDLPAFLILRERLLLKLEILLEKANEAGFPCNTFHVMSGYRTPYYNRLIGNVKLSAHQFGGAADIFIDVDPEDGEMDDLNRDGKIDQADSDILIALVDALSRNETFLPYLGGLGRYDKTRSHGPFVHVDVRGFRALW